MESWTNCIILSEFGCPIEMNETCPIVFNQALLLDSSDKTSVLFFHLFPAQIIYHSA